MNKRSSSNSPFTHFEICRVSSKGKRRHSDSPTSSILKTPTAIFVSTRSSSTKRLKFANGPVDLQSLKNSSEENSGSIDSALGTPENNGELNSEDSSIEVAVSPVKTMQVSPDSWKAFLAYKKFNDYANESEKTDYTYSRLSKFRHKEIIPGFLIRPNLSRASISSVSGKSSFYLPSDQSLNESFLSYDFKVDGSPLDEFKYDYKTPNSVHKSSRSKYFLRSSGDVSYGEMDPKSHFTERQYLSDSDPEPIIKKTSMYTTGSADLKGKSYVDYHHLTGTRSLDLDDTDLDEVDDDSALFHGINNQSNEWLERRKGAGAWTSSSVSTAAKSSSNLGNIFSTVFLFLAAVGNRSRNLFSRYILRQADHSRLENFDYWSGTGYSFMKENNYASSPYYDSVRYYNSQKSWYQRFVSYFSEIFSTLFNFTSRNGSRFNSYKIYDHQKTASKRRWSLWWLLIPFLILTGSFLGYIDFFSNPKAALNTIYNFVLFFPLFLHYTFTVFIPRLIMEILPHFFLVIIPNFIKGTLPTIFAAAVYYVWELIYFFASVSPGKILTQILALPWVFYNMMMYFGGVLFFWLLDVFLLSYHHTSNYIMIFYSYFCTYSFDLMTRVFRALWHSFGLVSQTWQNAVSFIWGFRGS